MSLLLHVPSQHITSLFLPSNCSTLFPFPLLSAPKSFPMPDGPGRLTGSVLGCNLDNRGILVFVVSAPNALELLDDAGGECGGCWIDSQGTGQFSLPGSRQ